MLPRLPRRLSVTVASLAAASLLLAGCGGDEEPASAPAPAEETSETAAAAPEEPALWPLTGLPMKGDAPEHPVIVTKVDNTSSSSPQVGLGQADMVVEELVEGGVTRLAAFYYSDCPRSSARSGRCARATSASSPPARTWSPAVPPP